MTDSAVAQWYFGTPDPKLQRYQLRPEIEDYRSLLACLPRRYNPIANWTRSPEQAPSSQYLTTWFRNDDHVAFFAPDNSRNPLTYAQLQQQITECPTYRATAPSVVAVLLPSKLMAETAVVLLSLLAQPNICVAPVDPGMSQSKILAALQQLQCTAVVTHRDIYKKIEKEVAFVRDIRVVERRTNQAVGTVQWTILKQEGCITAADFGDTPTKNPPAIVLRTSGTTSNPKIVPLSKSSLLYNATCLAASLQLKPDDVGCNAMPLHHVGGIACGLLTVLVSGSSIVMMPGPFDGSAFVDALYDSSAPERQPTWYYGVPSMHKAVLLTAKSRSTLLPNNRHRLRFVRSGAAHLSRSLALEMAEVFETPIIPTYSMSECMPVCSCHDVPAVQHNHQRAVGAQLAIPEDTVGVPIGCNLAVLDEDGRILPYGAIGEVALQGPGVMARYIGVPCEHSHSGAWFRTGDMGQLDRSGRLVLVGRSKEMIKRGGEQVWPNEVDAVIEAVPGIQAAVSFGVPNELWGEEVQVAVVLEEDSCADSQEHLLIEEIQQACLANLGPNTAPSRVHFVGTTDQLLKGSTGKYLRTKMAEHLGAKAVDTGALTALEAMSGLSDNCTGHIARKATPSVALNGVRLIAAVWVVQQHLGFYPSIAWLKIQTYSLNITIFMLLGAFQLSTSVKSSVWKHSAQFIGTKIGSMHALFMVAQCIALVSYLLFECGEYGYQAQFEGTTCAESVLPWFLPLWTINTLTGLLGGFDLSNGPSWFQSNYYALLFLFPLLDSHLRSKSNRYKWIILATTLLIASLGFTILFDFRDLTYVFVFWIPAWVAAITAGYFFAEYGPLDIDKQEEADVGSDLPQTNSSQHTRQWRRWLRKAWVWGVVADFLSLVFLVFEIIVALSPDCISMKVENFQEARPLAELPPSERSGIFYRNTLYEGDGSGYVYACNVTYEEFAEYIHDEPNDANWGRWGTAFGQMVGFGRLGTPLVLLWIYALANGRGATAWLTKTWPLQVLSQYAYALYLFHMPIGKLYWILTRGLQAEFWWPNSEGDYPIPVEWYEVLAIIAIAFVLAAILDRLILTWLSSYTIRAWIAAMSYFSKFCCCFCCSEVAAGDPDVNHAARQSTLEQVQRLVEGLTGNPFVDESTNVRDIGLDSLGATALLGTLKAGVPSAKALTLDQLTSCETVGSLAELLDGNEI